MTDGDTAEGPHRPPTGRLPGLMVAPPCLQVPPVRGHSEIGPMAADLTDPPARPAVTSKEEAG
jgi:hypothetical protein